MVGRFYMEVYKTTKVIKKCIVYKMTTAVRQETSWNVFKHETFKVKSLGQQVVAEHKQLVGPPAV
jgi:hypothetical protein